MPFGQVREISSPFPGDKTVSVRSGASAQHHLFGEKFSVRSNINIWDTIITKHENLTIKMQINTCGLNTSFTQGPNNDPPFLNFVFDCTIT